MCVCSGLTGFPQIKSSNLPVVSIDIATFGASSMGNGSETWCSFQKRKAPQNKRRKTHRRGSPGAANLPPPPRVPPKAWGRLSRRRGTSSSSFGISRRDRALTRRTACGTCEAERSPVAPGGFVNLSGLDWFGGGGCVSWASRPTTSPNQQLRVC